jgi:enoyl-CoA hydratase/carnithine racemase
LNVPELSINDRLPVRVVTIDGEARMNVLSRALVLELSAEARRAAGDDSVRAVVLTGSGARAFCAGANLKERRGWSDDDIRAWLVELHSGLREIERCPKPWIAAVNGLALGGGCELALACDLRVFDPAAQIGLTETRIGIIPGGGGTVRLARLIGLGRARDLILTARRVPAEEALRIGLADRVSASGQSVDAAVALGNDIACNAPVAVAAAKASIEEGWDLALDAALDRERAHYEKALRSADRLEGLQAFSEKRPPRWSGK